MRNYNKNRKLEIKVFHQGSRVELLFDGKRIDNIRAFKIEKRVGDTAATLLLDLNSVDITIDSPFIIKHDGLESEDIAIDDCL